MCACSCSQNEVRNPNLVACCSCRLSAIWLLSGKNAKLRSDAMCLLSALRGPPAPACSRSSNPWCMGMPRLLPCRPFSSILDRLRGQSIFSSVGLLGFPQTQPPAICVSFPHPLVHVGGTPPHCRYTLKRGIPLIPRTCGRALFAIRYFLTANACTLARMGGTPLNTVG